MLKLRETYPGWGKDKLVILLHREGFDCSASMAGRIIHELFVLPPRSPKLNDHVERAQRTHTEEFYEVTGANLEIGELNRALLKWEKVYNTVRPHQAHEIPYSTGVSGTMSAKKKGGNVSLII